MFELFQYSFMIRAFEAGVIISLIAPLIGIFLVLRRYSLIADTLAHVSLAGVAIGLLMKINPLFTAIAAALLSSLAIEKLRMSKRIYGESALAIFLSGSLALAIVLIGIAGGFKVDLFSYLFGSILTVKDEEMVIIGTLGAAILISIIAFYKELVFVTFDEEAAKVSGIPTRFINILLIILSSLTVSLAIPIVGVLLISALIVIPVVTALQFKRSFFHTLILAEIFSFCSVFAGIITAYYFNLATGGTIVLIALSIFIVAFITQEKK